MYALLVMLNRTGDFSLLTQTEILSEVLYWHVHIPYRTKLFIGINVREICNCQKLRKIKPTKSNIQQVLAAVRQYRRCKLFVSPTVVRFCDFLITSPALYHCAIQAQCKT